MNDRTEIFEMIASRCRRWHGLQACCGATSPVCAHPPGVVRETLTGCENLRSSEVVSREGVVDMTARLTSPEVLNPTGAPVEAYLRPRTLSLFWAKVDKRGPDECWPWTAATNPSGYGVFTTSYRNWTYSTSAHRVAWVIDNGQRVPEGLTVDHLCRNRACCNPLHLEPVTHSVNVGRGHRWR